MRGIVSNLFFALILIACLFLPVGAWNYWQGWAFLVVFELCAQALGAYFLINDRKVIERRVRVGPTAEREPAQKIISALIVASFIAAFVVPAFDHRFGWSPVAPAVSILGDALVALSFLIFFWVLKANSFAASTIRVEEGQPVISSGPYAHVRHPMYSGVLVLLVAIPLALGSWWGVLLLVPFLPVLLWRLLDEERFLRRKSSRLCRIRATGAPSADSCDLLDEAPKAPESPPADAPSVVADRTNDDLAPVLGEFAFEPASITALWPESRRGSPNVRAFVALLTELFLTSTPWDVVIEGGSAPPPSP